MKIEEPGHVYSLEDVPAYEGQLKKDIGRQTIRFVRRRDEKGMLLPYGEMEAGLLSQELVRCLIDRVRYLNDEEPCTEDVEIIRHLRETLKLFEYRAARKTIERMMMPETSEACPICHHFLCAHRTEERLSHEVRR